MAKKKPKKKPKPLEPPVSTGMFSQEALTRLVERTVPAERTNAIIGTVDKDGVALVVKMQKGDRWTVEAAFRRDWGGDLSAGAKVMYSW